MKVTTPYLLLEILQGQWAIYQQIAFSYGPIIAGLINGKPEDFTPRANWEFKFSESGKIFTGSDYNSAPAGSVAILPIKGTMLKYGTWCSYGTQEVAAFMNAAMDSKKISAIVLDIDSGGGSINSIPPILNVLEKKTKPVVALADMAASAAYFIAAACDHVMADNTLSAGFGSIGVLTSFVDFQPYWELQGIKFHTIYAPESKEKNQTLEKALRGDYELMQNEVLSPLARQFQENIKNFRKEKLKTETPGILTGKMFFANEALKNGLIDSIGNMEKAVQKAIDLVEVRKFMKT